MRTTAPSPTRPLTQPLGTGRGWRRVVFHHVPLGIASTVLFVRWMIPYGLRLKLIVAATGDIALGLLALTLLIGPANLLLRRANPVSNYLRRDIGIWAAGVSLIHAIVAFRLAYGQTGGVIASVRRFFFTTDGRLLTSGVGLGNWAGTAATLIAVSLLAVSTDVALRKLKAGPWKRLQRLNYALFVLVVAHVIGYGALSRPRSPAALLLGVCAVAVVAGQAVGTYRWRQSYASKAATGC